MQGHIVYSLKGRDAGECLVIIGTADDKLLVCNGKDRPLENPKAKNKKHLRFTNDLLPQDSLKTNKSLKKALFNYKLMCKENS